MDTIKKDKQDKHLQAPQEANTEKHINFRELEDGDERATSDKKNDEEDSPTKKAWKELREDNKKDED